jgi:uncharacterized 2Fe-2S/4Fe-4S cluster protein (DUF4445 family)
MDSFSIKFGPVGLETGCPAGSTILDCARRAGAEIVSVCGGKGTCGHCVVQVKAGRVSPVDDIEKKFINPRLLAAGYRLACRAKVLSDGEFYIPPQSLSTMQRLQVEGNEISVKPEPSINVYPVTISPPTLADVRADFERIQLALSAQGIKARVPEPSVARHLSAAMRNNGTLRLAMRGQEIIGALPGGRNPLGLAVDVGTTKIAVYLMDLITGKTLDVRGAANPQAEFGADIIARMAAAIHSSADALKIQRLISDTLNEAAAEMCARHGASREDIVEAVVVGNTAMHHLFLRLPVEQLALSPYVPSVSSAMDVRASDTGLDFAAGANLHLLPNIAGYVGADHVAMLLSIDILHQEGAVLAIDIGTNTEMCLSHEHRLMSLSCASGPAFEGAHISHGTRVIDGAIESLRISNGKVQYRTIGGKPPAGICGSGIIDTLAALVTNGVVDASGRMLEHSLVRDSNGVREFLIARGTGDSPDITFTQKDVRELQLAKGAIRTGIEVLLDENNLKEQDIDRVIIAGAFGTYIDVESAIDIGMFPAIPKDRFQQVGNAAGMGAKMALISGSKRSESRTIAEQVKYIELASHPDFNKIFTRSVRLGQAPVRRHYLI